MVTHRSMTQFQYFHTGYRRKGKHIRFWRFVARRKQVPRYQNIFPIFLNRVAYSVVKAYAIGPVTQRDSFSWSRWLESCQKTMDKLVTLLPMTFLDWLICSWWSMFRIAFSAVHRAAFRGLKWDFTFLTTVGADGFVHLSRPTVERAPSSITHFIHSFFLGYTQNTRKVLLVYCFWVWHTFL